MILDCVFDVIMVLATVVSAAALCVIAWKMCKKK
jgi:hypothetical protein